MGGGGVVVMLSPSLLLQFFAGCACFTVQNGQELLILGHIIILLVKCLL